MLKILLQVVFHGGNIQESYSLEQWLATFFPSDLVSFCAPPYSALPIGLLPHPVLFFGFPIYVFFHSRPSWNIQDPKGWHIAIK